MAESKRTASQIIVKKKPVGVPTPEDFELVKDVPVPDLEDGWILLEPVHVSVDPYLRGRLGEQEGKPVSSYTVARVVESKHPNYAKGELVSSVLNWATLIAVPAKFMEEKAQLRKVPPMLTDEAKEEQLVIDDTKVATSHFVGAMNMPGCTAWYGLLRVGALKEGDNVLVSGAAGAVGSLVGQIAKLKGCRVVGTAGSAAKLAWLTELGFDAGLNYKDLADDQAATAALKEQFPDGIDLYFDNTGGVVTNGAWSLLNKYARVVVCGQISMYNSRHELPRIETFLHELIYKSIRVEGFVVTDLKDWSPFYRDMAKWIGEGKVQVRETVLSGFEKLPEAFIGLFSGVNIGKMVVNI